MNRRKENKMLIKNTEQNKKVAKVVSTMAVENMYLDKEFIEELAKAANGEKTYEELRQELIKEYTN